MFGLVYEFPIVPIAKQTIKKRQFQRMADYINMKLLYFLIRVYFSPFWNEIEWGLNEA